MKRLNPKTGNPFKSGDVRADGLVFRQYIKHVQSDGYFRESWLRHEVRKKIKESCAEYCKIHYLSNRASKTEYRKIRRATHSELIAQQKKQSYELNKEQHLAQKRIYRQNNKGKINALVSARKKVIKQRTPKWLDVTSHAEIQFTYIWCAALRSCGLNYHVDHIVPLQGQNVSGLHVPWNLQVIPAIENIKKRNRWANG